MSIIRIPRTLGKIFHVPHGTPYHVENSLRGVELAFSEGYIGIDLDVNGDAEDNIWATHWGRPMLRDGFRDPLKRLSRFRQMHEMTSEEVARLRTRDGYRIRRASRLIKEARKRGLIVEVEAKPNPTLYRPAAWRNLAAELGGDVRDGLLVKVLLDLGPHPENRLKAAHAAGFRTCAIVHGGHGIKAEWAPFVDTYRR